MAKYKIFILCIIVFSGITRAQKILTLDEALKLTLENNYSILIAKANSEIYSNNASAGNAGMLPELNANTSYSRSNNFNKQTYNTGQIYNYTSVNADNTNASVTLSWTLFDGFKMFASLNKYKELKNQGDLLLKSEVENSVYSLLVSYYGIVHDLKLLAAYKNSLEISKIRLGIVSDKKELGSASKFDVLQAQVDLNEDSSNVMRQEVKISNEKTTLLRQIMCVKVPFDFTLEDSIPIKAYYDYDQLFDAAENNNKTIKLAEQRAALSKLDISLAKSDLYPKVNINTGYGYSRAENDVNSVKININYGYNYGISASINIFDGFNISRQIENAEISQKIAGLELEDAHLKVRAALTNAYKSYNTNFQLMKLEKSNVKTAYENVELAKEKLKLGTITYLEFRKIQNDFLNAENRLSNAEFETKTSEIDLLKLSGLIIK